MRTTTDVIEAARMGEPCTEEELRLCIVSMRHVLLRSHISHARWSLDESLPSRLRGEARCYWESVNKGFNVPLDVRVGEHDRPGHPSLPERKRVAEALWNKAQKDSP